MQVKSSKTRLSELSPLLLVLLISLRLCGVLTAQVNQVVCQELNFYSDTAHQSPAGFYDVLMDETADNPTPSPYPRPHFNLEGAQGVVENPICYLRNTKLRIQGRLKVIPTAPGNHYSGPIEILALAQAYDGVTGNFTFARSFPITTVTASGGFADLPAIETFDPLPNYVGFPPFGHFLVLVSGWC